MSNGKTTKLKIGKYDCTVTATNEPSEEAILRCRKVVTKIMRRIMSEEIEREESD
ncbi:hypothetical protein [Lysinibacillus sphaericus]|uniref:hypothetical protein n=1 Tax=Lysinibacillus sphaericus TaxID=1421 RepID=UPI0012BBD0ED|nr:hypothetical protein [Lysinibacillus sphaericus]